MVIMMIVGTVALLAGDPGVAAKADLPARVDAYLTPYVRTRNFSGVVLVARGDEVLVSQAYGAPQAANTADTRFHIASVSKSFTAAAILRLQETGKLRVADPVSRFLPDFPEGSRITVHQLLTHRSGIPNVNAMPEYDQRSLQHWTLAQIVGWFAGKPLTFEPGSRYGYSNSNYNLLAAIVEKASGRSYGEYLRREVLHRARLVDTAHDDGPTSGPRQARGMVPVGLDGTEPASAIDWSIKTGNGSLYSTAGDLHRWVRALRGGRVLRPESVAAMFTDHGDGAGYGCFVRPGPPPAIQMEGRSPGYSASVTESDGLVVVVASNLYSSLTQTLGPDLLALARGEAREPRVPAQPVTVPAEALARNVGRYQFGADFQFNPGVVAEVRATAGVLELVVGNGGGSAALLPVAADRFLDRLYGGTVTFVTDDGGKVTSLRWNFGRDYEAKRIE